MAKSKSTDKQQDDQVDDSGSATTAPAVTEEEPVTDEPMVSYLGPGARVMRKQDWERMGSKTENTRWDKINRFAVPARVFDKKAMAWLQSRPSEFSTEQ